MLKIWSFQASKKCVKCAPLLTQTCVDVLQIGKYTLKNNLIVAPMAGVTDRPFRELCMRYGAGMAVSEMMSSTPKLWKTSKSQNRMVHEGESGIRSVQIAGADPQLMAEAAQHCVETGAQIIDINMGCPAKKVCKKAAGSALLRDEPLVEAILHAVVDAVDVPVTLKIRTGWSPEQRNALTVARMAEDAGIAALAVHGRTRACGYSGQAEYDTIAAVARSVAIPVFANGDINTPQQAQAVLDHTGASAVMIGRAAQGRPWVFREIEHYLRTGELLDRPPLAEIRDILGTHLRELHRFYGQFPGGDVMGPRIARKHVGWYLKTLTDGESFRQTFNKLDIAEEQNASVQAFFERLITTEDQAA